MSLLVLKLANVNCNLQDLQFFFLTLSPREEKSIEVAFEPAWRRSNAINWADNDSFSQTLPKIYFTAIWHALKRSWESGEFQPWWKSAARSRVNRAAPNPETWETGGEIINASKAVKRIQLKKTESVNTADGEHLIHGRAISPRWHGISPHRGCLCQPVKEKG